MYHFVALFRKGRLNLVVLLVFLMSGLIGCKQSDSSATEKSDQTISSDSLQLNNIHFNDLNGNSIQLSDFEGKRVLLHFWATWCKPCIEEMPELERVRPLLEKENFQLLLVSEESAETIKAYEKKSNFDLEFLRYDGALSDLKIYALPATFVFNEKGEKVREISGKMNWDSEETITQLISLP
ncbi:peroxiredoxin [Algoriphagus ratkowskyi]|uniref:Peroxiredoxin n=1 Tax=Algoriphagus ratkowskyi TaxID=57028 RepID=A0A2W7RBF9_9BACT|nr:TlpA disulfide reductase family protein [Algoriphagus ratkowskyi]PZX53067.1 peroxiredoxin [Algoriphagus ratkowskyi]TXD76348.1 TlpA family protein disulfide reductase [Algoriphagus ratkowskyi]